jgi:large repetitive protein
VALDDPEALGGNVDGRKLVLGLDGADRVPDSQPVVVVADNRSLVAYDVVPHGQSPVTVTVATEEGWSLAGVFGAVGIGAEAAVAPLAAQGLDTALRPLAPGQGGSVRLFWIGDKAPPDPAPAPTARRPRRKRGRR